MSITTWRYPGGDEYRVDIGRPWPPEGDPWRARIHEFGTGAIHWRWDYERASPRWELVDAPPRSIVWASSLAAWIVDGRAYSHSPNIITLYGHERQVIYRRVHDHQRDHDGDDVALWLEWVD